jgi:hypothetical protein
VVSVEAAPRLYNEDFRRLRGELRESLKVEIVDDCEKMATSQSSFEMPT